MAVNVKGKTGKYSFHFYGDKKHLKEWASEGLDIIVIENTIPILIAKLGLTKLYCFLQK
jgi:hypothetical protein